MDILNDNNAPAGVSFTADTITVALSDGRVISAPLSWFAWLEAATPEQRCQYRLGSYSIVWPALGEGVDIEGLLLGQNDQHYLTVQEMAALKGVTINTIQRLLRADRDKPRDQRRLPGAYKAGGERRGEWRIPRDEAETWQPYQR